MKRASLILLMVLSPALRAFAAHDVLVNPFAAEEKWPKMPSSDITTYSGDYRIRFSFFQFREQEVYRVKAVVFVTDQRTGEPYTGPLTMRIVKKSIFGEGEEIVERNYDKAFENRYTHYAGFKYPAEFVVKVSFDGVDVEFPMTVGDPKPSYVIVALMALFILAIGGYVVYRKKSLKRTVATPAG